MWQRSPVPAWSGHMQARRSPRPSRAWQFLPAQPRAQLLPGSVCCSRPAEILQKFSRNPAELGFPGDLVTGSLRRSWGSVGRRSAGKWDGLDGKGAHRAGRAGVGASPSSDPAPSFCQHPSHAARLMWHRVPACWGQGRGMLRARCQSHQLLLSFIDEIREVPATKSFCAHPDPRCHQQQVWPGG